MQGDDIVPLGVKGLNKEIKNCLENRKYQTLYYKMYKKSKFYRSILSILFECRFSVLKIKGYCCGHLVFYHHTKLIPMRISFGRMTPN